MQSQTFSSTTTQLEPPAFVCGLRFDEYGELKFEDEKARLDNFAIQLSNEQLATGYIFMAAGQETFQNEATERLDRSKSYMVNSHRVHDLCAHFTRGRVVTESG